MPFKQLASSKLSQARTGRLTTSHGAIDTPFFMPIATRGAIKALATEDVEKIGAQIILSNTYHLWQRPGLKVIKKIGGLHKFMGWSGPILTDSGGFQVFSLARISKISEKGVTFNSEVDGRKYLLTPEKAIDIQRILGSDIIMSLDECTPYPCTRKYAQKSLQMTTRWAGRGLKYFRSKKIKKQFLFGIIQGSVFKDLREQSASELISLGFDGYALGGLAVGEPNSKMNEVLKHTVTLLPQDKPRYLMGVGKPEQIVAAVQYGIDMFDCVIPTRNARHGQLFVWQTNKVTGKFYKVIRIKQARYANDIKSLDSTCTCQLCQKYSRAYLRHLFMTGDPLAARLASLHNVNFYITLMKRLRRDIVGGRL